MKSVANWYVRIGALVLVLAVAVAALACGGNGGSTNLSPTGNNPGASASAATKSAGVVVTESEIPNLPAWQQELLSDQGWNQPFIDPREDTPIVAPTNDMFEETLKNDMASVNDLDPHSTGSVSKGASWRDPKGFDPAITAGRGQYNPADAGPNETPGFGCNVNHGNEYSDSGSDDPILAKITFGSANQRISYVVQGLTSPNIFNGNHGGTGNDALSCVYQLFSDDEEADPKDDTSVAKFMELSYRSDLGGNHSSGPDCTAVAWEVAEGFWKAFNRKIAALPNGAQTPAYNILVAPAGDVSAESTSSGSSIGMTQDFYLGNVATCYGASKIIGIISSTSSCQRFNDFVSQAYTTNTGFFYRPLYGVLLRRWQATLTPGAAGAEEGVMGWPVNGPVAYSDGASTLTARGTYYAWGMWFEKGYIWWIDYNQATNPTTPDEGQAYAYTGSNVYCKDGVYQKMTTAYYGGAGDLAATVSVDGYRNVGDPAWTPGNFQNNKYFIPIADANGLGSVEVALSAHPYGGTPRAVDCLYKKCTWAFRDGQIQAAGADYDQGQFLTTHIYGSASQNMENTYVVRVQVVDSANIKGYGDSYPIVIGHLSGAVEILVVRDDNGTYNTNYNAIIDDLNTLQAPYAQYTYNGSLPGNVNDMKLVIWYRGGPATGEPNLTSAWSSGGPQALLICWRPAPTFCCSRRTTPVAAWLRTTRTTP